MTLVVLPDSGQQASASGHQNRAGCGSQSNDRMAAAGTSGQDVFGRAHPFAAQPGSPDLQNLEPLPICICGKAVEGNCWCESLGFLKDMEACKLVMQRGCRQSRVAILLSIHEEFCRSASGNNIINVRRRGSAHGDLRIRHSKPTPPPTLPRPRAHSMIVPNARSKSSKSKHVNAHVLVRDRPQVAPKPSDSQHAVRQRRVVSTGCMDSRSKPTSDGREVEGTIAPCRLSPNDNAAPAQDLKSKADEPSPECNVDQSSYVSRTFMLLRGCAVQDGRNTFEEHIEKESGQKKSGLGTRGACSAGARERLAGEKPEEHVDQSEKTADKLVKHKQSQICTNSKITGLEVFSVRKQKCQSQEEKAEEKPVQRHDQDVSRTKSEGPYEKHDTGDSTDALQQRLAYTAEHNSSVDIHLNVTNQDQSQIGQDCVFEDRSVTDLGACASEDKSLSSDTSAKVCDRKHLPSVDQDREFDIEDHHVDLLHSTRRSDRLSCRDSGIVDDLSIADLKVSSSRSVIQESQSESDESETCCNKGESVANGVSHPDLHPDLVAEATQWANLQTHKNVAIHVDTITEGPLPEDNVEGLSDSAMGACAIIDCDVETSVDSQLPDAKPSFVSSAFVICKPDSKFKTEQCLYLLDGEVCDKKTSKQVFISGAKVQMRSNEKFVSVLQVDVSTETATEKADEKNDGEEVAAKPKSCRRLARGEKRCSREHRPPRNLNPAKVGMLRYLINQSPLVLCEIEDSDFEESDSESEESSNVANENVFAVMSIFIVAKIFDYLDTRDLAMLKCTCKDFKWLIENFDIKGRDSKWVESLSYRNDPCMQCGKIRDPRGDVSLCCWHPKIYYRNGHIGRRYWTCCLNPDEDAAGCQTGLHDNNWTTSKVTMRSIPKPWRSHMWHLCYPNEVRWPDL